MNPIKYVRRYSKIMKLGLNKILSNGGRLRKKKKKGIKLRSKIFSDYKIRFEEKIM